jgi:flagellar motor switch protein FliN/FliY
MDDQNQLKAALKFANSFAESLAEAMTQRLGTPWLLKSLEDEVDTKHPDLAVHFRLSAVGGLQGECFVAFDESQVIALGSKLLEQPAAALSDQQGEALGAVIVSAVEGLSSALTEQFGVVTLRVDRVEDVCLDGMLVAALSASGADTEGAPVLMYFNEPLLAALSPSTVTKTPPKVKKSTMDAANLQLVMDVELNVSLRFGQCQLPLRDVLDLTSGSVIELDRDVDDPVELLLDGKVIARGEAVIVDGNYGLRITEIPEPLANHFVSQPHEERS